MSEKISLDSSGQRYIFFPTFFTFVRHKAVSGKTSKYIPLECMLRVKRQT